VHPNGLQPSGGNYRRLGRNRFHSAHSLCLGLIAAILILAPFRGVSAPQFDTSTPLSFFTNVACRLVASELNLNLFQLQVYPTNQYTPAVHRLLQVTANIYEATTNNQFPSVFRPVFAVSYSGGNRIVYISGFSEVSSLNSFTIGTPPLDAPVDVTAPTLRTGANLNESFGNVYGVPWIIGAKKGFPAFNQFYMRNTVQVTRKLQLSRAYGNMPGGTASNPTTTNQMFTMSITNSIGFSFWNSYESDYVSTAPITAYFSDTLSMSLTNDIGNGNPTIGGNPNTMFTNIFTVDALPPNSSWPGSAWSTFGAINGVFALEQQMPDSNSFLSMSVDIPFLPESDFQAAVNNFVQSGSGTWGTNSTTCPPFPQFGLMTTNWIQAFILDGNHVIDYVQLSGPNGVRNVAEEIRDKASDPGYPTNYTSGLLMWLTNVSPNASASLGVVDQINVSQNNPAGSISQFWKSPPNMPAGFQGVRDAESAYFSGFFNPTYTYFGRTYVNTNTLIQAPYTPSRTAWEYTTWQANDPLVHYLASDLNAFTRQTGLHKADNLLTAAYQSPNLNSLNDHYQPWGRNRQMSQLGINVDSDAYNLRYRDPLVWGSDYWDFPSGQAWNLNWIGRVHRGTPWQTIYLKASDILAETVPFGGQQVNIGVNTWAQWTGDTNTQDAALTSPASDSLLVSLLGGMLNTNDLRTQFSVNTTDSKAWASLMDGFVVLSNITDFPASYTTPVYNNLVISSNSPTSDGLGFVSAYINCTRSIFVNPDGMAGTFEHVGDILRVPALSEQSPFLDFTDALTSGDRLKYDISDEAYEAIPSQLLPLLRMDSIGSMVSSNGQVQVQFSGYDGHVYTVQASPDLKNWTNISTNSPANGKLNLNVIPMGNAPCLFFRTLLQQ
jgi:hypothetical protein